jgi:hypothetical protein
LEVKREVGEFGCRVLGWCEGEGDVEGEGEGNEKGKEKRKEKRKDGGVGCNR